MYRKTFTLRLFSFFKSEEKIALWTLSIRIWEGERTLAIQSKTHDQNDQFPHPYWQYTSWDKHLNLNMLRLSFLSYMIIIYTILCMLGIQLRFIMIVFRGTKTLRCNIHFKNWPRSHIYMQHHLNKN